MFICNICKSSLATINLYNKHHKSHKNLGNVEIICLHSNCNVKLTSYQSFQKHIYREHKNTVRDNNYTCKMQNCSFKTFQANLIIKHVKDHLKNLIMEYHVPFLDALEKVKCFII